MDMQEDIPNFQSGFNGPFPFTTDGVVIGVPNASFEEEMQTKITFAERARSTSTRSTTRTCTSGGATTSPRRTTTSRSSRKGWRRSASTSSPPRTHRPRGPARRRRRGVRAEPRRHVQPDVRGHRSSLWTGAPSDPRPYTLFSGSTTYTRPGIAYIALRRILGPANFAAALQQIQRTYRQGSITEPQLEAGFTAFLPVQTACVQCAARASSSRSGATPSIRRGGGANRPQITGPGLDGGGFHCS